MSSEQFEQPACLKNFQPGAAQLMVWEAFVSGALKSDSHQGDAVSAVAAFAAQGPSPVSGIDFEPSANLLAASLLATGHRIDTDELGIAGLVVATQEI
jgi:hypothetical protein